jgi:hypothetical protein
MENEVVDLGLVFLVVLVVLVVSVVLAILVNLFPQATQYHRPHYQDQVHWEVWEAKERCQQYSRQ